MSFKDVLIRNNLKKKILFLRKTQLLSGRPSGSMYTYTPSPPQKKKKKKQKTKKKQKQKQKKKQKQKNKNNNNTHTHTDVCLDTKLIKLYQFNIPRIIQFFFLLKTVVSSHSHLLSFNSLKINFAGASSGIGASTALLFSKLGAGLALAGRNSANLEKIGKKCYEASGIKVNI